MKWETRAVGIALAGGSLTMGGCSSSDHIPCGNANPDPCICGRPQESAIAAQQCSVYSACLDAGGLYSPGTSASDGALLTPPSCTVDAGTGDASDAMTTDAADARPG